MSIMVLSGLLCFLLATYLQATSPAFPCPDGIECIQIEASKMTFDCRIAGKHADGHVRNVILLHGFPERAAMYDELALKLVDHGYRTLACDQRGYSPGASPDIQAEYTPDLIRDDVFALADAQGFHEFHLVGNDFGSVVGWYLLGCPHCKQPARRVLSFTAIAVPHLEVFSESLYSPHGDYQQTDEPQQIASQYLATFTLPDSASLFNGYLYNRAGGNSTGFNSAKEMQKALWWYNGVVGQIWAAPPQFSVFLLAMNGNRSTALSRALYGINPHFPVEGLQRQVPIGNVAPPVLFVCGNADVFLLCSRPFAQKTKRYCQGGYKYLEVNCGHNVVNCPDKTEKEKALDGIVDHILMSHDLDEKVV